MTAQLRPWPPPPASPPLRLPAPSRPLPPPPWPLLGVTPAWEVLPRLVEAVRDLEGSLWALRLDQDMTALGMPKYVHRIDIALGRAPLACRPEGKARTHAKRLPPVGHYTVTKIVEDAPPLRLAGTTLQMPLWDGELRYVTASGLLSRDRSHARIFVDEAEARTYAAAHIDPKTPLVFSATYSNPMCNGCTLRIA